MLMSIFDTGFLLMGGTLLHVAFWELNGVFLFLASCGVVRSFFVR
jgi:hypothetical protein